MPPRDTVDILMMTSQTLMTKQIYVLNAVSFLVLLLQDLPSDFLLCLIWDGFGGTVCYAAASIRFIERLLSL